jgi:hypothetical protein
VNDWAPLLAVGALFLGVLVWRRVVPRGGRRRPHEDGPGPGAWKADPLDREGGPDGD